MSVTRLDCYTYRGIRAARDVSSYFAATPLALGHARHSNASIGRFVFAGSAAAREGLGSQVAYRLALDYFLSGVTAFLGGVRDPIPSHGSSQGAAHDHFPIPGTSGSEEAAVELLHDAFRSANASVYSFGHKLAAGGRMSASLIGLVVEGGKLAAGRAGVGSVYLYRDGGLLPFFENPEDSERIGDASETPDLHALKRLSFIGANSVVDVEVASVDLQPGDIACVFSRPLTNLNETLLLESLEAFEADRVFEGSSGKRRMDVASMLCKEVFTEPDTLSFAVLLRAGPDTIFCDQIVIE